MGAFGEPKDSSGQLDLFSWLFQNDPAAHVRFEADRLRDFQNNPLRGSERERRHKERSMVKDSG